MEPVNVLEWAVYEVQLAHQMKISGHNCERIFHPGERLTGIAVSDGWLLDVGFLLWRAGMSIGDAKRQVDRCRVPERLRFQSHHMYVSDKQKAIYSWLTDPLVRLSYSLEEDL